MPATDLDKRAAAQLALSLFDGAQDPRTINDRILAAMVAHREAGAAAAQERIAALEADIGKLGAALDLCVEALASDAPCYNSYWNAHQAGEDALKEVEWRAKIAN